MQCGPVRLQQVIRAAFQAARPRPSLSGDGRNLRQLHLTSTKPAKLRAQVRALHTWPSRVPIQVRYYSDKQKLDAEREAELKKIIDDAQSRINETIEERAEAARPDPELFKKDETIVHTIPESSSIVYTSDLPGGSAAKAAQKDAEEGMKDEHSSTGRSQFYSSTAANLSSTRSAVQARVEQQYAKTRKRFFTFMDNFQSHVFVAGKRLNDLTGYSSIEQLKKDIEAQEEAVRDARQAVKDARTAYAAAIERRSQTQKETNDLLHRKHTWSPLDVERFTELYRSDHANEQAEQRAHEKLSQSETQYEESSTRLAKSILARYHEEQIWSDKIRQMSTWGTWALMGLNVLLFVVFQILVEPWRRRRLVRGFEEKVQRALETSGHDQALIRALQQENIDLKLAPVASLTAAAAKAADNSITSTDPGSEVQTQLQKEQEQIASAEVTIQDMDPKTLAALQAQQATTSDHSDSREQLAELELTAERLTNAEVAEEQTSTQIPDQTSGTTASQNSSSQMVTEVVAVAEPVDKPLPSLSETHWAQMPDVLLAHATQSLEYYGLRIRSLFDDEKVVSLTQKNLTNSVLEGAFFGAVGVICFFWVAGVGSVSR